jgi:hypothetical protein
MEGTAMLRLGLRYAAGRVLCGRDVSGKPPDHAAAQGLGLRDAGMAPRAIGRAR